MIDSWLETVRSFVDTDNDNFRKLVSFSLLAIGLVLHEFAHAVTALWFGDESVRPRVSLNPLKHLDPVFSILVPLLMLFQLNAIFGAGKPVPVQVDRLRHPNLALSVVSAAGPAMNVLLAALATGAFVLAVDRGMPVHAYAGDVLWTAIKLNLLLAVFNLLPVPPLDGHRVVGFFLPARLRERFYRMWWLGLLLILGMIFLGGFEVFHDRILSPVGKWWMNWMPDGAARLFAPRGMG